MREKRTQLIKQEAHFFASVKIDDLVRHKDPTMVKKEKMLRMQNDLDKQVQIKASMDSEGRFFGMTNEEILLNKDTFIKMGLL